MNVREWMFDFSFDVGRSMFDVHLCNNPIWHKCDAYERLQNNLALMGRRPGLEYDTPSGLNTAWIPKGDE